MIIINNEEALRIKCEDVTPDEAGELISKLESELNRANSLGKGGIGLAAPQIGIAKNIAIIRLPKTNLDLINCSISKSYDPGVFRSEGCLSFPGRVEDTTRFQETFIVNNLVYPHSFVAEGLLSIVCQHELDHLNSILFLDRIVPKQKPILNSVKISPNDPCICGISDPLTGKAKKFKKCCGK